MQRKIVKSYIRSITHYIIFLSTSLYNVNLETAIPQATRFGKAKNIEKCACPPEYSGTSCQVSLQAQIPSAPLAWIVFHHSRCFLFKSVYEAQCNA